MQTKRYGGEVVVVSTACYVTCISNPVLYTKTKSRQRSLAPQLYMDNILSYRYQYENAVELMLLFHNGHCCFYPVRRPPCCVDRKARYGSQSIPRVFDHIFWAVGESCGRGIRSKSVVNISNSHRATVKIRWINSIPSYKQKYCAEWSTHATEWMNKGH